MITVKIYISNIYIKKCPNNVIWTSVKKVMINLIILELIKGFLIMKLLYF